MSVLLFALVSPLDPLGDEYLFSAHMTQHLLLTLVVPPLLLLGTPDWLLRPVFRYQTVRKAARFLTSPLVAFLLFNAVFMIWHIPAWYEATLHNEDIHIFEHLLFISTGVLNWWPVLGPAPEVPRLPAPAGVLYLFLEGIPTTILAAIITLSPSVLYPTYAVAPRITSLSPLSDQVTAGIIMWMPGGMIYLIGIIAVFLNWVHKEENVGRAKLV
jgi:putative membrane protein